MPVAAVMEKLFLDAANGVQSSGLGELPEE